MSAQQLYKVTISSHECVEEETPEPADAFENKADAFEYNAKVHITVLVFPPLVRLLEFHSHYSNSPK